MKRFLLKFIVFIMPCAVLACGVPLEKYISLDPVFREKFAKSGKNKAIVVLKKEKKLLLVNSDMCVESEFLVSTGKNPGRKSFSGDNATPEGIYEIIRVNSSVEPDYIKELEKKALSENDKKLYEKLYLEKNEFIKGKKALDAMNSVYLYAKDGHAKYGTNQDLGLNSYGPVFLRLNYPNEDDLVYRKKLIKEKRMPLNADGTPKSAGSGIAIHGTNDPDSIGHDASSGCIRMKNEDIIILLNHAPKGTIVMIRGE